VPFSIELVLIAVSVLYYSELSASHLVNMSTQSKAAAVPAEPPVPFVVPEGIKIEHRPGPITGRPMFKVSGFEMPFQSSEEIAVQVFQRLKAAYTNGFFTAGSRK